MMDSMIGGVVQQFSDWHGPLAILIHVFHIAGKVLILQRRQKRAHDGNYAGYTLLNRYTADVNYSHWHITTPALRGLGLSTALYPYRIKTYFDTVPIHRLIHQTRTRNVAVNKMLDHWVPVAETCHIEQPDGVRFLVNFICATCFAMTFQAFLKGRHWNRG
jgi:hypothetical protein